MYYGWKQRGKELTALEERYGKMLERMNRSYMDMEVEPTFTFSGTAADVTPYQQQIDQMRGELEDYVAASNGLPDPNYVRQQQTNIARLKAALNTLPKEAQGEEALLQVLGGNYYDNVTVGGTAAQIGLGLAGLDLPMDLRDLFYDLTHLRTTPWQQTLLDALAILPVVGGMKYADEAVELVQTGRRAGALAEGAGAVADTARAGQRVAEAEGVVSRGTEAASEMSSAAGLPKEFYLQPRAALDEDWYKQYNAARERYAEAAANSGTAETVTYYRVQGGTKGNQISKSRVAVNADGTIAISNKGENLNVSAYGMEHALHYQANNRVGADIVAFDVPRWFDDFVRQEAIIQSHYKTNPLNQGGAAPKLTDLTKPGFKFELPPIWHDWLEEYAFNARVIPYGGG